MAQTTGAMSMRDAKVELSTNGTVWTDVSGFFSSVEVSGGERDVSEKKTASGDTPIITIGKRAGMDIKVSTVYTEAASEPFEIVNTAYEAGSALYVRWSPKGGQSGEKQFTSGVGTALNPVYPSGSVENADAILTEFTVRVATIVPSTVSP